MTICRQCCCNMGALNVDFCTIKCLGEYKEERAVYIRLRAYETPSDFPEVKSGKFPVMKKKQILAMSGQLPENIDE